MTNRIARLRIAQGAIAGSTMYEYPATTPVYSISVSSASRQYLSMSDSNFGAFNREKFSISVWVKLGSANTNMGIIGQGNADLGTESFLLALDAFRRLAFHTSSDGTFNNIKQLATTATYASTSTWYHIVVHYDSANAVSGDRMRMWVNGSEISSFDNDVSPAAPVFNSSAPITIGTTYGVGGDFNGLIYQPAFFSGTLAPAAVIYNGGTPIDITGMAGLFSHLGVASGVVTADDILANDWINNNAATASALIPS